MASLRSNPHDHSNQHSCPLLASYKLSRPTRAREQPCIHTSSTLEQNDSQLFHNLQPNRIRKTSMQVLFGHLHIWPLSPEKFPDYIPIQQIMTRQQILDLYFLDARHKLVELAAFLDRVERADGKDDFRLKARFLRHDYTPVNWPATKRRKSKKCFARLQRPDGLNRLTKRRPKARPEHLQNKIGHR